MSTRDRHPLAGKTVKLGDKATDPVRNTVVPGAEYRIEDWWINVSGRSWADSNANPAAMVYAIRSGTTDLPWDDDVLYGKVDGLGCLVHVSELGEVSA